MADKKPLNAVHSRIRWWSLLLCLAIVSASPAPRARGQGWHSIVDQILSRGTDQEISDYSRLSNTGPLYDLCQPYLRTVSSNAGDWQPIGPTSLAPRQPKAVLLGLGRINRLAFDPQDKNVIYAGSATGPLWRTADGGKNWTAISDALGVSGIAVDPTAPKTIYLFSGDGDGLTVSSFHVMSSGVFKTIDGGEHWAHQPLPVKRPYVGYDLVINPDDPEVLLAPTNAGLYRTDNAGDTWIEVLEGSFYDVELKPDNPSVVYATSVNVVNADAGTDADTHVARIYRSVDGGVTWDEKETLDFGTKNGRVALAVMEEDPEIVYAVAGSEDGLYGFLRSQDSGENYIKIANTPNILGSDNWEFWGDAASAEPDRILALASSAQEVWAGSFNSWKSTDGGRNWSGGTFWIRLPWFRGRLIHLDFHDLQFDRGRLFAGNDGGVYRKDKQRNHWKDLSSGLNIVRMYGICGDPEDADVFYFGAHDAGTMRLNLKDQSATALSYYDGMDCLVDSKNPKLIFSSAQKGKLFRSTNGENSVSMAPPGTSGRGPWVTPFTAYPGNVQRIFECLSKTKGIWQTMNGGRLWNNIDPEGATSSEDVDEESTLEDDCRGIAATATAPPAVYVARPCSLFKGVESASTGESSGWDWEEINFPQPPGGEEDGKTFCDPAWKPSIRSLAVNPRQPEEIWITFNGFIKDVKVFRGRPLESGAYEWQNISRGLPNVAANTLHFDPETGVVYLGMDCGLFYYDGAKWIPFFNHLPWPNTVVQDLLIQRKKSGERFIRAATFSQGAWESPVYKKTTGTSQTKKE